MNEILVETVKIQTDQGLHFIVPDYIPPPILIRIQNVTVKSNTLLTYNGQGPVVPIDTRKRVIGKQCRPRSDAT